MTDREGLDQVLKLPKVALDPTHELGIVLDQVLKAAHQVQRIRTDLSNGDLLVGVKEMSKVFDRFVEIVEGSAEAAMGTVLKPVPRRSASTRSASWSCSPSPSRAGASSPRPAARRR